MLVYYVHWTHSPELSKGKGRVKSSDSYIIFTVLCRSSVDAMYTLEYIFEHHYKNPNKLELSDGEIKIARVKLDSRNFKFDWLFMDNIPRPLRMFDLNDSIAELVTGCTGKRNFKFY